MGIDSSGRRQMTLVAFLQAQNCSNYPASWRHAAAAPDFLTADYYQRIARTLEAGRVSPALFDHPPAHPPPHRRNLPHLLPDRIPAGEVELNPPATVIRRAD